MGAVFAVGGITPTARGGSIACGAPPSWGGRAPTTPAEGACGTFTCLPGTLGIWKGG